MPAIRILTVDDHEGWRGEVRSLLQVRPEWQVICEASDGAEAVQKADKLKPDLILLDVSFPNLNGIEAARQIRCCSPGSRILFLSSDNSLDVVRVALSTGAQGYVYKARAQSDLLPAIDAVLRGEEFVTSMLKGYKFTDTLAAKSRSHDIQFYSDDEVLLESFTSSVTAALQSGDVAIIAATEFHRDGIVERLKARGLDVAAAILQGTYISVDAMKILSTFMVNDMPDADLFFEVAGGLIRAAAKAGKREHPRVVLCGECAPLLWAQGKPDAAIRLEQLCNQLAGIYEIDILCGFALSSFHDVQAQHVFQSICRGE